LPLGREEINDARSNYKEQTEREHNQQPIAILLM